MSTLRLFDDIYINWNLVRYAECMGEIHAGPNKGQWMWRVRFQDGSNVDIALENGPGEHIHPPRTIPALPGFSIVAPLGECEGLWTSPIVAWRVGGSVPVPVPVDALPTEYAILQPDGTVVDQCSADYQNKQEWLAVLKRRARKKETAGE